jgi:hypothetical protein
MMDFIEMEVNKNEEELNYINKTYLTPKETYEQEQANKEYVLRIINWYSKIIEKFTKGNMMLEVMIKKIEEDIAFKLEK